VPLPPPGSRFPDIEVKDARGEPASLPTRDSIVAFFKTTCPTCELTWPYLERLRRLAQGSGLSFAAVSQDRPELAADFQRRLGTDLPTFYDLEPWRASERAGLVTVPTVFLLGEDGTVAQSLEGFQRAGLESLASRAAERGGRPGPLFGPGDSVPEVKPG
jgi:thiol-disulfide isomerase/thioredoxin